MIFDLKEGTVTLIVQAAKYVMPFSFLKIICSTCIVTTMDKNCFGNIHEQFNSLQIKFWYTTKLFNSAEQYKCK